mmetsp:Transcript_90439/g.235456  ORF Transcript_90439/g.235456 Transcript_90439/m.235456 type:complete len:723 (+) Transcript_90439:434-2602(+)
MPQEVREDVVTVALLLGVVHWAAHGALHGGAALLELVLCGVCGRRPVLAAPRGFAAVGPRKRGRGLRRRRAAPLLVLLRHGDPRVDARLGARHPGLAPARARLVQRGEHRLLVHFRAEPVEALRHGGHGVRLGQLLRRQLAGPRVGLQAGAGRVLLPRRLVIGALLRGIRRLRQQLLHFDGLGQHRRAPQRPRLLGDRIHARVSRATVLGPGKHAAQAALRVLHRHLRLEVAASTGEHGPQVDPRPGGLHGEGWVRLLSALAGVQRPLHLPHGVADLVLPATAQGQPSVPRHVGDDLADGAVVERPRLLWRRLLVGGPLLLRGAPQHQLLLLANQLFLHLGLALRRAEFLRHFLRLGQLLLHRAELVAHLLLHATQAVGALPEVAQDPLSQVGPEHAARKPAVYLQRRRIDHALHLQLAERRQQPLPLLRIVAQLEHGERLPDAGDREEHVALRRQLLVAVALRDCSVVRRARGGRPEQDVPRPFAPELVHQDIGQTTQAPCYGHGLFQLLGGSAEEAEPLDPGLQPRERLPSVLRALVPALVEAHARGPVRRGEHLRVAVAAAASPVLPVERIPLGRLLHAFGQDGTIHELEKPVDVHVLHGVHHPAAHGKEARLQGGVQRPLAVVLLSLLADVREHAEPERLGSRRGALLLARLPQVSAQLVEQGLALPGPLPVDQLHEGLDLPLGALARHLGRNGLDQHASAPMHVDHGPDVVLAQRPS